MQIRATSVPGGETLIEVIDPSDGQVTHKAVVCEGEQITVTATAATSPADIEFGEVEAIPVAEPDEGQAKGQPTPEEVSAAREEREAAQREAAAQEEGDDPEDQAA